MNFVKEQVDELNAILKIQVTEVDYAEKLDKQLKDYQKKATIPGFRPGKVPAGMIKKMHGKTILVNEINKLLNDNLKNYINENKLDVLGDPLPRRNEDEINWDAQKDFEFSYDLAFAPKFELEISPKHKFDFFTVNVDDTLVNKYVNDIAKRYGKVTNAEVVEENDVVFGDLVELDASGTVEAGVIKSTSISMERIKNTTIKKTILGVAKESTVIFGAKELKLDKIDGATILGISQDKVGELVNDYKFTIKNISRIEPAALNAELFKKVYGEAVSTEDEFKNKIKEELSMMLLADSDRRFKNEVMKKFVESIPFNLPDEFLKRWLIAVNEKPITMEQINNEYDKYVTSLRYQLIENKIIRDNNISVTPDELKTYVAKLIKEQFAKFNGGTSEMEESELNSTVNKILANQEEAKKLFEGLYEKKMLNLLKSNLTLNKKEVSYEDFYKA